MNLEKRIQQPINRRNFLKKTVKTVAGASALAVTGIGGATALRKRNYIMNLLMDQNIKSNESFKKGVEYIKKTYGITVISGEPNDLMLTGENGSVPGICRVLHTLIEELSLYPVSFFERGFFGKNVYLVRNLKMGAVFSQPRKIDGVANDINGFIVIDMDSLTIKETDMSRVRGIIHHEIFHSRENDKDKMLVDKKWVRLQESLSAVKYGNSNLDTSDWSVTRNGFSTAYGSSAPSEDRAELARIMMSPVNHSVFLQYLLEVKDDNIRKLLLTKYKYIKSRYKVWSGGYMNDAYWDEILSRANQKKIDLHFTMGAYE